MDKEIEEAPLWLTAYTRAKNKEYCGGEKGDIWVCGLDEDQPWCLETKCEYCSRVCYYIPGNEDLVKTDAKKICPVCALEKHGTDMPEEMKELFKKVMD